MKHQKCTLKGKTKTDYKKSHYSSGKIYHIKM